MSELKPCDYCIHVEMCGWRKDVEEQGCEFYDDANKWIPCSERLPKPNEVVLLCGQYNMLCGYINDEGRWYSMSGDGWETDMEFPDKGKIIAWMPLPEPFREGESE